MKKSTFNRSREPFRLDPSKFAKKIPKLFGSREPSQSHLVFRMAPGNPQSHENGNPEKSIFPANLFGWPPAILNPMKTGIQKSLSFLQGLPKSIILFLFSFPLLGCSSMLCTKEDSQQGVFFDFDPILKTVDIGAYPTFHEKYDWVKKMIVKGDGFLIVYSQKTVHCDNREEMKKNIHLACKGHKIVENHYIIRYTDNTGYEEWSYMPEKEWKDVKKINHVFLKKPDYHYKNCRFKIFGGLRMLMQIIKRI